MTTSLYFHWPFCELKCPYCDFNSHVREKTDHTKWLRAYLKEIDFYADYLKGKEIKTIYFGGGTPSLMKPEMIAEIINKIKAEFNLRNNAEITIEANPASSEIEKFKAFKDAGINRISIGIQSFNEERLKFLGRKHNRAQAIKAIEAAKEIFGNFTFDLIYATKGQTEKSWSDELDFALKFDPPHISLYQLTIEKGTEFYSETKNGAIKTTKDELSENLYFQTLERLKHNGLERYEISNFAKQGFESQHNMNYWNYGEYMGIGAGAHSRVKIKPAGELSESRYSIYDIHNPENWLDAVFKKGNGIQKKAILSKQQMLEEMLYMGLRIREGISLNNFQKVLEKDFFEIFKKEKISFFEQEGLLKLTESHLKLTDNGIMLHSSLCKKIINLGAPL